MLNFVSQAKIFIDAPGPRGASKQLLTATKLDVKDEASRKVITTIGVTRGAGTRKEQGGFTLSLTLVRETGQIPEVDWDFYNDTDKIFTITTQDENNGRRQAYTCQVSKTDTTKDDKGVHEDTVDLVSTQRF